MSMKESREKSKERVRVNDINCQVNSIFFTVNEQESGREVN